MTDKTPVTRTADEIKRSITDALWERHNLTLHDGAVEGFTIGVKIKPEMGDIGFRKVRTGKMRVTIGDHWAYMGMFKTKSYPQRKDGSHSYDKIADELAKMYEIVKARSEAKTRLTAKKTTNEETIEAVREELGVKDAKVSVCPSTGCLVFKVFDVKPYDVIEFATLAQQLGYLSEK